MTLRSTRRSLQYILLVLSLCASIRAIAAPVVERGRAIEFATLRAPSPTALIPHGGPFYNHVRRLPSGSSLFTLVPFENRAVDSGHLVVLIDGRVPESPCIPASVGQRSPPIS